MFGDDFCVCFDFHLNVFCFIVSLDIQVMDDQLLNFLPHSCSSVMLVFSHKIYSGAEIWQGSPK